MLKRACKSAAATSLGVTLGGLVLPRVLSPHLYNQSYPPIYKQAALYFIVGFAVSFAVYLLIEGYRYLNNQE